MNQRRIFMVMVICMAVASGTKAQISPGPLTTAHAELEGVTNCTQCHTLGERISDSKCLACHEEIQELITAGRGYHASREVQSQDCADCHSEHHGRRFDMTRFDEDAFNHNLTGYELTGAHRRTDCRQCHQPDLISDRELKRREGTFLGLSTNCASCHEDYHQNTLSTNQCAQCHTTDAFVPARRFDHNETAFPLRGQHTTVDCAACHQEEVRNGEPFRVFSGIAFNNCNACHTDAHQNNLGQDCKQCHTEDSFAERSGLRRFNHSRTNFPLKGSHQRINCAACHNLTAPPSRIFQDRLGIATQDCASCHQDVHEQKFGDTCADCHQETSFQDVNTDNFNHMLTGFELKGKHQAVDCRSCHTASFVEPMPHNTCAACHSDYHEGAFTSAPPVRDCAVCHSEDGFEVTLYTLEQHNQSQFPLTGAHLATPCFACHLQEEEWVFRDLGASCVDCHEDVHAGYIAARFYPEQNCTECHVTDSWQDNHFDHNQTEFPLLGAHREQHCMACHTADEEPAVSRYAGFRDPSGACVSCHENIHRDQFAREGVTDCTRCHNFNAWAISDFDHDRTDFKLEGRHAEIACESCHQPTVVAGETIIQYQFESFACIDCHQ